jgi:hypothetical protein
LKARESGPFFCFPLAQIAPGDLHGQPCGFFDPAAQGRPWAAYSLAFGRRIIEGMRELRERPMSVFSRRVVTATTVMGLVLGAIGLAAAQSANPTPGAQSRTDGVAPAGKAVAAQGGRVVAQGPGYSIVATSPSRASAAPGQTSVTDAPLEVLHEPIVCQGDRVLNIDNRNIRIEGNAIVAEDGCELHITNSRISAGGIAIRARNASVHIENSEIEGRKASIDAAHGAQIYVEASTFKGAALRLGQAAIHDLGNNAWD